MEMKQEYSELELIDVKPVPVLLSYAEIPKIEACPLTLQEDNPQTQEFKFNKCNIKNEPLDIKTDLSLVKKEINIEEECCITNLKEVKSEPLLMSEIEIQDVDENYHLINQTDTSQKHECNNESLDIKTDFSDLKTIFGDHCIQKHSEKTSRKNKTECECPVCQKLSCTTSDSIPEKSKRQYEKCYSEFKNWCDKQNVSMMSENILLAYLTQKSKVVKSSTLWSIYSMLKCMLNVREGIDVRKFSKLVQFLKRKAVGYQATKSKAFTHEQIDLFLKEANDETYLLLKVVLIMGVSGALRRDELVKMAIEDIQEENTVLIVTVPDINTDKKRIFTVTNTDFIRIYRKYAALRPKHIGNNHRIFLRYVSGKCTTQVVGVHTIGKVPSMIAKYLRLPNPETYTGHCFRRSSATLLANRG